MSLPPASAPSASPAAAAQTPGPPAWPPAPKECASGCFGNERELFACRSQVGSCSLDTSLSALRAPRSCVSQPAGMRIFGSVARGCRRHDQNTAGPSLRELRPRPSSGRTSAPSAAPRPSPWGHLSDCGRSRPEAGLAGGPGARPSNSLVLLRARRVRDLLWGLMRVRGRERSG